MPIQGAAADIIKMAMLKINKRLKEENLKAKMIMQVHDEIVIDAPAKERDEVIKILRQCMENVVTLSVPLVIDISVKNNWYDCK